MKAVHRFVIAIGAFLGTSGLLAQTATLTASTSILRGNEDTVAFTIHIVYQTRPTALGSEIVLPEGWTYVAGENEPEVRPSAGQTSRLGWAFVAVPADGATFSFTARLASHTAAPPHVFCGSVIFYEADTPRTLELASLNIDQQP